VSDEVRDLLLREGFDEEYGARPLRRTIQTYVDDTLADAMLNGAVAPGQVAHLVLHDGKVAVEAQTVAQAA
jgi:ATP-dependent Clp protease ATP-binding subunit ClpC